MQFPNYLNSNNWSSRRTVQLTSWVEMKARNQNLLSWKDKKGCIIKKLFFRKREVMQECTIKCFLSAAQVGAVSKKAITNFSSEKAMERKALKHPFLWIEFIPAGSKAIQPIPTLHWTNTQFKSYYFKAFLPCHQWLPKRKHAEVALSFAAEEMMVHSKWDFNLLFFFFIIEGKIKTIELSWSIFISFHLSFFLKFTFMSSISIFFKKKHIYTDLSFL